MANLGERVTSERVVRARRIKVIVSILLAISVVAAAAFYWFVSGGNFDKAKRTVGSIIGEDKVNIMVMGVDERGDDVGRSDTLFVLSIDKKTKQVSMLSIPRDTRVNIPGHGFDKINHAYAFGGHKLTQKSVEGLLGMPMDYYMVINMAGFKKIVDAIGGVDIDVEKRMYYDDPYDDDGGLHINLRSGLQHMNGDTAIQYVRYRDEEGDIGRVGRQQKFMRAVLTQAASPTIITKLPGIISGLNSAIKTDLSTSEMLNLAKLVNDASKQGMKADMVPGKPAYIDDISYWLPDIVALREHMAKSLGITMDDKYVTTARREANEYEKSIPKEMKVIELPKVQAKAESKAAAPSQITVSVVNASGSAGAGNKIAAMLRAQGLEVTSVSASGSVQSGTTVIANTDNSSVVSKLKNLPFPYSLQVHSGGGAATATVIVGRDFAGNESAKEAPKETTKESSKDPVKDIPKEMPKPPAAK
ncbi:MAG: LCP family protein [Pelosinus sp.]|nr:LCP family protein [Pelosinus sp.]